MSNPKLAYTNFFETGIVSASSEATGYEKENAYDGLTFDSWKPTTSGTHYLTVYNTHSQAADYWAIFAHDLHINSATVKLQYSNDNFASDVNDVGTAIGPIDSRVIFREFSPITSDYWRIEVISDVAPSSIGVAMIGSALELESTLPVDASNFIAYARDNEYINNNSNAGTLLGRSLLRRGLNGKINFRFMLPSWFRSNWEIFMDHAEKKPFVFVADPTNYPEEAIYTYLDGKQTDPRPTNAKYMNFSLNVRGFLYSDSGLFDGWDINTANYSGSPEKKFNVGTQDTEPYSLSIKPDGLIIFVLGFNNRTVFQYELSTAWEINTASFTGSPEKKFSVVTQATSPQGIFVKPDGTELYVTDGTTNTIYQYTLSTPWDITSASYSGSPEKKFSVSGETTNPKELSIRSDGKVLFLADAAFSRIHQYTLGTAWEINTASYDSKFLDVSGEGSSHHGLHTRPNGSNIYVLTGSNDRISQYQLSTSWTIDTASYTSKNFSVTSQDTLPRGIFIKPDGLSLYLVGDTNNTIYQYDMG